MPLPRDAECRLAGPLRGTPVSARSYALPSVSAAGPSGGGSRLASPLINRFTVLLIGLLNIVHKAKSDYFSSQIAQSNCCKELLRVCNELRGCNSGLSLPTALPVCDLPGAFADYFIRKVKTIRDELDSQMPVPILPTDGPYTQSSLHFFEPVSMQCVKNTILQSSQKTCSLDPLPTSLFVECLEQLLPAVTAVINQSLHTGVFPCF